MTATCAQLALVLASDQNYLHNTDRQHCRLALGRTPVEKRGMAGELQTCHDAIHLTRLHGRGITCRQRQRRLLFGFPLIFSAPTAQTLN